MDIEAHLEQHLQAWQDEHGRAPRVLDFGCGYGRHMIPMLDRWDVWGYEILQRDVERGRKELADAGHDSNRIRYPDEFTDTYDFVFSYEVFEHVADIDSAVSELRRLSHPGTVHFHGFPGKWRPMEGHLLMPVVHWLPKNHSRRALIRLFTRAGMGGRPPELSNTATAREVADFQYDYTVTQTFYRSHRQSVSAFRRHGFIVDEAVNGWLRRTFGHELMVATAS